MKIQMCFQTCTHVFFPCRIPPASLTRGNQDLIKAVPQCFIISLKAAGLLNNKVSAPECTWHPAAVIKHLLSEWKWNAVITYNWGSDLVWTVQGHFPKKCHMRQTQGRKLPSGETKNEGSLPGTIAFTLGTLGKETNPRAKQEIRRECCVKPVWRSGVRALAPTVMWHLNTWFLPSW